MGRPFDYWNVIRVSSMVRAQRCIVCGSEQVKYRFACCRQRYCSVPCFKAHTDAGCSSATAAEPTKKRAREEDNVEEEEEEDLLSEVRLCGLRGHQGIREAIRSEKFCEVLVQLDAATDRRKALEDLLANDKFFVKFAENAIEAVDYFPKQARAATSSTS